MPHRHDQASPRALDAPRPAMVLLTPLWLGSVVSASHGLYGLATKGLFVVLVDAFGIALAVAHKHFTVSWPRRRKRPHCDK